VERVSVGRRRVEWGGDASKMEDMRTTGRRCVEEGGDVYSREERFRVDRKKTPLPGGFSIYYVP